MKSVISLITASVFSITVAANEEVKLITDVLVSSQLHHTQQQMQQELQASVERLSSEFKVMVAADQQLNDYQSEQALLAQATKVKKED
jgi:hypothetical protein